MPSIELVDIAEIPGGGELHLLRYGPDYSIQLGDDELMGNQEPESEIALAKLTREHLDHDPENILIGGLGMGFTLGAALDAFPKATKILVAELIPQVAAWARGPLAHLFGDTLSDPRVSLEIRDVHDIIAQADGAFDAILLDVDNGPDGFVNDANDRLYCNWGLRAAYRALRPGGVLAVWSSYGDDAFVRRLETAGFRVTATTIAAISDPTRTPHTIWFGRRLA